MNKKIMTPFVKDYIKNLFKNTIQTMETCEFEYSIENLVEYSYNLLETWYEFTFQKPIGKYHKHYLYQLLHELIYDNKESEWFQNLVKFEWKQEYNEYDFDFKPQTNKYRLQRVEFLNNEPKQVQSSQKWFNFRKTCLTASNITSIINNKNLNSILLDKCGYSTRFVSGAAILHGKKYEDVAVLIYEHRTGLKVFSDYGCIRHPHFKFIGASPDGIDEVGNVIEIKCVYSRQLTSLPKQDYYDQMQLQMEVFRLSKCLFLECEIKEYSNFKEFKQDTFIDDDGQNVENKTVQGNEKGVIFRIITTDPNEPLRYCYPENLNMTHADVKEWVKKQKKILKESDPDKKTYKEYDAIYWKLTDLSCIEVYKDKRWIYRNLTVLYTFWNKVEEYKHDNEKLMQLYTQENSKSKKKTKVEQMMEKVYFLEDSDDESDDESN